MPPLTVKLLVALSCFTAVYLTTEAAETCRTASTSCIPGLPGRDGRDGSPGLPGPPGPPLTRDILDDIGAECRGRYSFHPATSCKEVYQCNSTAPSGYYWIRTAVGVVWVYCVMETTNCGNSTGGWMRAAYIDVTNENNTCPQGFNVTVINSTRMCVRSHTGSGCFSVTFPTFSVPYTKVCGRARGYQYATPDGFAKYESDMSFPDVEGLIVTHGSPRNHIWSFAAGLSKDYNYGGNCPCAAPYPGGAARPIVGEEYFCESGNTGEYEFQWYLDDPLWDSLGCAANSTCCDRGGPWFSTVLGQEVSDDIEVGMCLDQTTSDEDIGISQLEVFVY